MKRLGIYRYKPTGIFFVAFYFEEDNDFVVVNLEETGTWDKEGFEKNFELVKK